MDKREIKFRGISKETGLFVYGFYVQGMYDGTSKIVEHGICRKGCYPVEVIEDTVSQFTGMKDKHGTDIYEMDIVDIDYGEYIPSPYNIKGFTGVVKFIDGSFMVEKDTYLVDFLFQEIVVVEVIGNIHQKPMPKVKPPKQEENEDSSVDTEDKK